MLGYDSAIPLVAIDTEFSITFLFVNNYLCTREADQQVPLEGGRGVLL